MGKSFRVAGRDIFVDQIYFVAFAGGKREIDPKDQKAYDRAIILPPGEARQRELRALGPEKNPNLVPITGAKLLELIKDAKIMPMFDAFFDRTRMIQLNDEIVYESLKQKNYDLARG